jgi:hypothetical protein
VEGRGLAARVYLPLLDLGRVFSLFSRFRLQRPPLCGWSAVAQHVALTYATTVVVGLAPHQAGRAGLVRSPIRMLADTWEGVLL